MKDIVTGLREANAELGGLDAALPNIYNRAADEIDRLRAALESLTKDPPRSLAREPDTDCEVILKMRAIAKAALVPQSVR